MDHRRGVARAGALVGTPTAEATHRPLVDAVARCQQAGFFTGDDSHRIALHVWAAAHGMVNLELNGQIPDLGAAAELYADALRYAGTPS